MKNCNQYKGAAGFTLIEVLVAVVVVALGCLATLAFHSSAIHSGSQADTLTVASFLGESQIELLRDVEFNALQTAVGAASSSTACFSGTVDACSANDAFGDCTVCYTECLNRAGEACASPDGRGCFKRTTGLIAGMPTTRSHTVRVAVEWRGPTGDHQVLYDSMISAFGY